eukprot:1343697-Amphidinium_carterae.1
MHSSSHKHGEPQMQALMSDTIHKKLMEVAHTPSTISMHTHHTTSPKVGRTRRYRAPSNNHQHCPNRASIKQQPQIYQDT